MGRGNLEVRGQLGGQQEGHSKSRVPSVADLDGVLVETINGADFEINRVSRDKDGEI